jgi:two-component system, LytTR family, sensor kinase
LLPNLSFKRILIVYSTFWFLWMVMHTYLLMDFGVQFRIALVDSLITHVIFAITSFIVFITLKYYQPSHENFFYIRIWAILLAIANTAIIVSSLQYLYSLDESYQHLLEKSIPLRFCYQVLMVATITLLQWLGNYLVEQRSFEGRKQETERFAKEAELYNLRQQLQPHFLFNSLNSISALAGSQPDQARVMIQQLSEFLRHTLRKDEQQLISLKEELYQLDLYLQIEKVRFGNRLLSSISIYKNCEQLLLPVLVLQPLVENAIKFGLYDTLGEVEILIKATCLEGKQLQIEISNPFDPQTHNQNGGTGFGLDSIKRRMYLLYASNDLVQTEIKEKQFTVRVNIPQL